MLHSMVLDGKIAPYEASGTFDTADHGMVLTIVLIRPLSMPLAPA